MPEPEETPALPEELRGMTDEQLSQAFIDAIRRNGKIRTDELNVACENQLVRLEGLFPDKRRLSHLHEVVYDVLGLVDVEENIRIDREAWVRRNRAPGTGDETASWEDSSSGSGAETITPADQIIPEKKK